MKLHTIGYEGAELSDFISTLETVGIRHVIDIRDRPLSRKKGFSKNQLRQALETVAIDYTHIQGLGDPKPGRDAMRQGDVVAFLEIFTAHLETRPAIDGLAQAGEIAERESAVLLCFERDPKHCHRNLVAARIAAVTSLTVQHLGVLTSRGAGRHAKESRAIAVG